MPTRPVSARHVKQKLEERAAALEEKVEARHEENLRRLDRIDATQKETKEEISAIARDVRSLLESRSFTKGVWKTAATAGGLVSGIVAIISFIVGYVRGH